MSTLDQSQVTGITLGYAQITATFSTTSTTAVQVTGLTTTVTIPAGGRRVKITAFARDVFLSAATAGNIVVSIWDGAVGTGTQVGATALNTGTNSGLGLPVAAYAVLTPSAGSKTYNVGIQVPGSTGNLEAGATYPAFILVELI